MSNGKEREKATYSREDSMRGASSVWRGRVCLACILFLVGQWRGVLYSRSYLDEVDQKDGLIAHHIFFFSELRFWHCV